MIISLVIHKRQNSLTRYFVSGGKIDIANCSVGHGWAGLKNKKCDFVHGRLMGWMLQAMAKGWSALKKS